MRVVLIGYTGYWGVNLARVLRELGHDVENINSTNIASLEDSDADAAVIATPPATHFNLAMRAMRLGMDVFLEKPATLRIRDARLLMEYAKENKLVLSIDSTFLFTNAFEYLSNLDQALISYQSLRMAPAMPHQVYVNAAWDLLWHDMAILHGFGLLEAGQGQTDGGVACAAMTLPSGGSAFMVGSRVWPQKVREIVLHFSRESYLWTLSGVSTLGGRICAAEHEEPLKRAIKDFERRCRDRALTGRTDGQHAYAVTETIVRTFTDQIDKGRYAREYAEAIRGANALHCLHEQS